MTYLDRFADHILRLLLRKELRAWMQSIEFTLREIRDTLWRCRDDAAAAAVADRGVTRTRVVCPFCGIQTEACSPTAVVKHEWRIGHDNYIRIYAVTGSSQHLIAPCCEGLRLHYEGLHLVAQRIT